MSALAVLFIDDADDGVEAVCEALTRAGHVVAPVRVATAAALQAALADRTWDLIVSEYAPAGLGARQALDIVRARDEDVPFILFSDVPGDGEAVELLRAGAQDCVRREHVERMPFVVARERIAAAARRDHRHRAEALRESEERHRLLLDSTAEAICAIDLDGRCTWCNPACLRLLGYASADIVGADIHALVHARRPDGQPLPAADCRIGQACRRGEGLRAVDEVFWRRDATPVPVECWSYPIRRGGQLLGSVVTFIDVAARRQTEQALGESDRRFRATFEQAGIGIAVVDAGGYPVQANGVLCRMLGYTAEVLAGMPFAEFTHPDDREADLALFRELLAGERDGYQIEKRYIRRDGRDLSARLTASLVRDEAGRPQYTIGMVEDISDRRRLEERVQQAQRMEAVGLLAGGVAHDFNNLLTAIVGFSDLVLGRPDLPESVREDVGEILNAGRSAAALTRQLLTFSRRQVLQPQRLDLNVVVADIEPLVRRTTAEDVTLDVRLTPEPGWISADPGQIEQAIMNLVVNARDAMPTGGTLTIETAPADIDAAGDERYPSAAPGEYVRLTVQDTGVGMTDSVQAHLFEPFFTTKARGTARGLGLATVYGTVTQSGGTIAVESEVGRGTAVHVLLRREPAPAEAEPDAPTAAAPARGHETILLVEDQAEVRAVSRAALTRHGYRVLEASYGEEALAIALRDDAAIDLMLTDVVMPGMSGRELATRVLAHRPGLRVLFASGYAEDVIAHHGVLESGVAFIQKPFAADGLLRRVRALLDDAG